MNSQVPSCYQIPYNQLECPWEQDQEFTLNLLRDCHSIRRRLLIDREIIVCGSLQNPRCDYQALVAVAKVKKNFPEQKILLVSDVDPSLHDQIDFSKKFETLFVFDKFPGELLQRIKKSALVIKAAHPNQDPAFREGMRHTPHVFTDFGMSQSRFVRGSISNRRFNPCSFQGKQAFVNKDKKSADFSEIKNKILLYAL